MRGHNVYFYGAIRKIIPKLSLLPFLIWTSDIIKEQPHYLNIPEVAHSADEVVSVPVLDRHSLLFSL